MRMFLTEYSIIYKSFSNKIVLYDIYLEIKYHHQIKQMDPGPYFLSFKRIFKIMPILLKLCGQALHMKRASCCIRQRRILIFYYDSKIMLPLYFCCS